jgi:hypothetical protein
MIANKLQALASALGVELREESGEVLAEAPGDRIFLASGLHTFWADDAAQAERWLKEGLTACVRFDCERCAPAQAERSQARGARQAAHLAGAHEGHADRLCLLCPMQEAK